VWGAIASILVANFLLLILNTAFIPFFTFSIEKIQPFLVPFITVLCMTGTYMYSQSMVAVGIMLIFGVLGYFMRKNDFPLAPFVLAIVLGDMLESNLRQSLLVSNNSFSIFFTRPISLVLMIITILIFVTPIFRKVINFARKKANN